MKKPAAIILSGGESIRMGYPKWNLPMGRVVLLEYIVHSIAPHVSRIVVCCGNERPDIELPKVDFVLDEIPESGPIEGIRVGLKKLNQTDEFAYVTACDSPFPVADVIRLLMTRIKDHDAAIPVRQERVFGMSSLYRTRIHREITALIDKKLLRVSGLSKLTNAVHIPIGEIERIDPQLNSIFNINSPNDYFQLLEMLDLKCPDAVRQVMLNQRRN